MVGHVSVRGTTSVLPSDRSFASPKKFLLSPVLLCASQAERLQYYETLMLACERLGCPEGAARFAQAAVRQVSQLVS